eukprot:GDKH01020186.1.p2 GENE.GDKH01020186.1~~GDKH01020186.1.p2  ORF type:complete len:83 (-),score=3.86 GDKH01020186.1:112-360(-)
MCMQASAAAGLSPYTALALKVRQSPQFASPATIDSSYLSVRTLQPVYGTGSSAQTRSRKNAGPSSFVIPPPRAAATAPDAPD